MNTELGVVDEGQLQHHMTCDWSWLSNSYVPYSEKSLEAVSQKEADTNSGYASISLLKRGMARRILKLEWVASSHISSYK
jgi:hypothetical protein